MRRTTASVQALTTTSTGKPALRLRTVPGAVVTPGQISLGCLKGGSEPLRQMLVPVELRADGFTCLQPEGVRWLPGDDLDLLGPLGHGFTPPPGRSRWLLASRGLAFEALLPLLSLGLSRRAEMAAWTEQPPTLPPEVEVLPRLEPALAWADYLALAVSLDGLRQLETDPAVLALRQHARAAEILVLPPMACGTGVCAACALEGSRGRIRACTDGPVFPLSEVLP